MNMCMLERTLVLCKDTPPSTMLQFLNNGVTIMIFSNQYLVVLCLLTPFFGVKKIEWSMSTLPFYPHRCSFDKKVACTLISHLNLNRKKDDPHSRKGHGVIFHKNSIGATGHKSNVQNAPATS